MTIEEEMAKEITPKELDQLQKENKNMLIIDVRKQEKYKESHIEDALHIPLSELENYVTQIPRKRNIVVYCQKGISSKSAQAILIENNFTDVYSLTGGYEQYQKENE